MPLLDLSNATAFRYAGQNIDRARINGVDIWPSGLPPMTDRFLRANAVSSSSTAAGITLNFTEPDPVPAGCLLVCIASLTQEARVPSIDDFDLVASWPEINGTGQTTYVFAKESDGVENGLRINVTSGLAYNMGRVLMAFSGFVSTEPTYAVAQPQPSGREHFFPAPPVSTRGVLLNMVSRVSAVTWDEGIPTAEVGRTWISRQVMPGAEPAQASATSNQVSRTIQLVFPLA